VSGFGAGPVGAAFTGIAFIGAGGGQVSTRYGLPSVVVTSAIWVRTTRPVGTGPATAAGGAICAAGTAFSGGAIGAVGPVGKGSATAAGGGAIAAWCPDCGFFVPSNFRLLVSDFDLKNLNVPGPLVPPKPVAGVTWCVGLTGCSLHEILVLE
jgi:hypothetical protein